MTDHLGSVIAVSDEDGDIVWRNEYTPYGENIVDEEGNDDFAFFTGKMMDIETGLYYFNARWYDPGIGRFISEDPVRDGDCWYAYCGNNPINYIDPWGLELANPAWNNESYANHMVSDDGPYAGMSLADSLYGNNGSTYIGDGSGFDSHMETYYTYKKVRDFETGREAYIQEEHQREVYTKKKDKGEDTEESSDPSPESGAPADGEQGNTSGETAIINIPSGLFDSGFTREANLRIRSKYNDKFYNHGFNYFSPDNANELADIFDGKNYKNVIFIGGHGHRKYG